MSWSKGQAPSTDAAILETTGLHQMVDLGSLSNLLAWKMGWMRWSESWTSNRCSSCLGLERGKLPFSSGHWFEPRTCYPQASVTASSSLTWHPETSPDTWFHPSSIPLSLARWTSSCFSFVRLLQEQMQATRDWTSASFGHCPFWLGCRLPVPCFEVSLPFWQQACEWTGSWCLGDPACSSFGSFFVLQVYSPPSGVFLRMAVWSLPEVWCSSSRQPWTLSSKLWGPRIAWLVVYCSLSGSCHHRRLLVSICAAWAAFELTLVNSWKLGWLAQTHNREPPTRCSARFSSAH